MDDKEKYLRWLEEMWDVHKFDLLGSAEREEKRKEDILEMLRGLAYLSKRLVEQPGFPSPRRASDDAQAGHSGPTAEEDDSAG